MEYTPEITYFGIRCQIRYCSKYNILMKAVEPLTSPKITIEEICYKTFAYFYSGILTVEPNFSYSFVYMVICFQALTRFKAKVLLNSEDVIEANVVCKHCTHVNTKEK